MGAHKLHSIINDLNNFDISFFSMTKEDRQTMFEQSYMGINMNKSLLDYCQKTVKPKELDSNNFWIDKECLFNYFTVEDVQGHTVYKRLYVPVIQRKWRSNKEYSNQVSLGKRMYRTVGSEWTKAEDGSYKRNPAITSSKLWLVDIFALAQTGDFASLKSEVWGQQCDGGQVHMASQKIDLEWLRQPQEII